MTACKCGARAFDRISCPPCASGAAWRAYDVRVAVFGRGVLSFTIPGGRGVQCAQDAMGRAIRLAGGVGYASVPVARELGREEALGLGIAA